MARPKLRREDDIRFYEDPQTGEPHLYLHEVSEQEVFEILLNPEDNYVEDRAGNNGTRLAIGQTNAGRYLRVVYIPDPGKASLCVLTAYEPTAKVLKALRRRRK